jgi:hypothetical protein
MTKADLSNAYEHESGTQKGHYLAVPGKLAEPAVKFAKYAHAAAFVEACNVNFRYDATCIAGIRLRGSEAT